jgi:hypothetical protein
MWKDTSPVPVTAGQEGWGETITDATAGLGAFVVQIPITRGLVMKSLGADWYKIPAALREPFV